MRRTIIIIAVIVAGWLGWGESHALTIMHVRPSQSASAPAELASWTNDAVQSARLSIRAHTAVAGSSAPLSLAGAMGRNIRVALSANGGALQTVIIPPGSTWSFNAAVGDPRGFQLYVVGGVLGGGWCDLASRYVQAVRPILPPESVKFVNHVQSAGVGLANVDPGDAVAIWNIDGRPGTFGGRLDLLISNPLPDPIVLRVVPGDQPDTIVIEARIGYSFQP